MSSFDVWTSEGAADAIMMLIQPVVQEIVAIPLQWLQLDREVQATQHRQTSINMADQRTRECDLIFQTAQMHLEQIY